MSFSSHIPITNSNRSQDILIPTFITVHETANISIGANAEMHSRYVKGLDAQSRQVSWHITVDDEKVIQHLPFNEVGWHANAKANYSSIGIEICVNKDGDFKKSRNNAILAIRKLIYLLEIPRENVVTHQYWTGKNCPANLLKNWNHFKNDLYKDFNKEKKQNPKKLRVLTDSLWTYNKPDWNARFTIVHRGEIFTIKKELYVDNSRMYQLKSGLFITGNPNFVETIS